ncbi:MAG: hypothetical protein KDB05_05705 [Planctomycetales bacterium]|nr:hypothetical protein [Planctomycetales bacterium]
MSVVWDASYVSLRGNGTKPRTGKSTRSIRTDWGLGVARASALDPNGGMLLAHDLRAASAWMDDPPTSRYGRHIEGSGVHHHPTPGPADGKWLYGHNWVALAWLATHPVGGAIALPLRREVDVPKLSERCNSEFRT